MVLCLVDCCHGCMVQLFDPMGIHHVLFLLWQSKHPPLTPVLRITYMIIVFKLVLLINTLDYIIFFYIKLETQLGRKNSKKATDSPVCATTH